MSPNDDSRLKKITWIFGISVPLIFVILVAYFPIINNNSKAATEALTEIKNLKESQNYKFKTIDDKLDQQNARIEGELTEIKNNVSINKQNFRTIADKLRDQGLLKNVIIIDRNILTNTN